MCSCKLFYFFKCKYKQRLFYSNQKLEVFVSIFYYHPLQYKLKTVSIHYLFNSIKTFKTNLNFIHKNH